MMRQFPLSKRTLSSFNQTPPPLSTSGVRTSPFGPRRRRFPVSAQPAFGIPLLTRRAPPS